MSDASVPEIIDYALGPADAFERLNLEWLEKYFEVEPIERDVLSDPEARIIAPGGAILYLKLDAEIVGTVALKHDGDGVYELTKMAVTEGCQGQGLGRHLLSAAIGRFVDLGGQRLYLESNSRLKPALALYESAGFQHEAPESSSKYQRADVYMVYRENASRGAKKPK